MQLMRRIKILKYNENKMTVYRKCYNAKGSLMVCEDPKKLRCSFSLISRQEFSLDLMIRRSLLAMASVAPLTLSPGLEKTRRSLNLRVRKQTSNQVLLDLKSAGGWINFAFTWLPWVSKKDTLSRLYKAKSNLKLWSGTKKQHRLKKSLAEQLYVCEKAYQS